MSDGTYKLSYKKYEKCLKMSQARRTRNFARSAKRVPSEEYGANYLNIQSEFPVFLCSRTGKLFDKNR